MSSIRLACAVMSVAVVSGCCLVEKKPETQPLADVPLHRVIESVADEIALARKNLCDKHQKLNVYLHDLDLTLDLKRDNSREGGVTVGLPPIGMATASVTGKVTSSTTTDNTVSIKFQAVGVPSGTGPCDGDGPMLRVIPRGFDQNK